MPRIGSFMIVRLSVLITWFSLLACQTPSFQAPADHDLLAADYPTRERVKNDEIKVYVNYPEISKSTVVMFVHSNSKQLEYQKFLRNSLEDLGLNPVLDAEEFQMLLVQKQLTDYVPETSGHGFYSVINLHKIAAKVPRLIVVEALLECQPQSCTSELRVLEPSTSRYLLRAQKTTNQVFTLDWALNYPTANLLREWVRTSVGAE